MLSLRMKWIVPLLAAAGVAVVAISPRADAADAAGPEVIARGKYLATIMVCNDCHTPLKMGPNGPEPDMSRQFSGHPAEQVLPAPPELAPDAAWNVVINNSLTAFAGPFGISYARNLTPDDETGLGKWTEEQFVRALRTGRHQGVPEGRMILPPMPWPWAGQATDEDLHALWSFLQSLPPIKNAAPQSIPAPPPPAKG